MMEKDEVWWEGGDDQMRAGHDALEVPLMQLEVFSRHISIGSTMLVGQP